MCPKKELERLSEAQKNSEPSITQLKELVLKTAEVFESNKDMWNERDVGKLPSKLAKFDKNKVKFHSKAQLNLWK